MRVAGAHLRNPNEGARELQRYSKRLGDALDDLGRSCVISDPNVPRVTNGRGRQRAWAQREAVAIVTEIRRRERASLKLTCAVQRLHDSYHSGLLRRDHDVQ